MIALEFFDNYRDALLSHEADRIASFYSLPALVAAPGSTIGIREPGQVRNFFAATEDQYDDVHDAAFDCSVVLATGHSIWADVTWQFVGQAPSERFCYQLLKADEEWLIGVLTPL